MNFRKISLFLTFLIFSSIFSPIYKPLSYMYIGNGHGLKIANNSGVSKYQIGESVIYELEINFTVSRLAGTADFYFKVPRLNERTINSSLTPFCPPYQESSLLFNKITGFKASEIKKGIHDRFNNTYDSYNATLNQFNQEVKLSQKYRVKLNEISFSNIQDSDITNYNYSDHIFNLYCNKSEKFYNRNDINLINLSNSITNVADNPVEKSEKICNWVSQNLDYNPNLSYEIGASSAYGNKSGDCSEFSSLMITLLRIQNIPARKVTGFVLSNNPSTQPKKGDTYNFYFNDEKPSNLLGHSWVEYYVENIGWIACDPTWHKSTGTYFNRIDYLRLGFNVGAWFYYPPDLNLSEFSYPMIYGIASPDFDYDYNYNLKVMVIDSDFLPIDLNLILILLAITGVIIVVAVSIILISKKRKKKRENNQFY